MARNLDPKCRQCRREGEKLFLKAEKCFTEKCAIEKRNYPPGQHGQRRASRLSDYGVQLREKQKLKGYYGNIGEKQFRNIFKEAAASKGDTSENLLVLLESRLDAIIYRSNFVPTVFAARQFINHKHVKVNGSVVNISSYKCKPGDEIEVKEKSRSFPFLIDSIQKLKRDLPEYISLNAKEFKTTYVRYPSPDEIPYPTIMCHV